MSTEGWKDRMAAALATEGCKSQTEWLEKFPGRHCWFVFDTTPGRDYESCASCGKVKQRDESKQKPCQGIVTVSLR